MSANTVLSSVASSSRSWPAVLFFLTALLMVARPSFADSPRDSTYTVTFPGTASIAELKLIVPGEDSEQNRKKPYLAARGTLTLPKRCRIFVKLCYAGLDNMQSLEQLDKEQVVLFSANRLEFTDAHLIHLKQFRNLDLLDLNDTLVSDKSLPLIAQLTQLSTLRANNTDITGSGFAVLSDLPKLGGLHVQGTNLKPGSLAKLKGLAPHLTTLNVAKTGLTKVDMPAISAFKHLTNLEVDGNKSVDDSCVKYFLPLVNLETLYISDTSITDKSLPDLYKLPALKTVIIRNSQFWTGGKPQKTKPGIEFQDKAGKARVPLEMFSPLH
jgi:hypothetical protein